MVVAQMSSRTECLWRATGHASTDCQSWLLPAVRVKLLRRDQYSRAVATVEYGQWPLRRNIGEDLVREGLAVVYRQSGAEYDGRLAVLEDLEAQARARRLGLWSSAKPQLPSEYKAQLRADKAAGAAKQPARAPALAPQP